MAVLADTLLLIPTGTLPSRRGRPVAVLNFLATGLLLTGFILLPRPVALPAAGWLLADGAVRAVLGAAAVSLMLGYRAGGAELRRQINWVALAGVAFAVFQLVAIVAIVADHGKQPPVAGINRTVVYGLVSAGLTAVYAGIVPGIAALAGRQGGPVLTVGAAGVTALHWPAGIGR